MNNILFLIGSNFREAYRLCCGRACSWTDNLDIFEELLHGKRYDLIAKLIDSETPATQYLAIQTLYYLKENKQYEIDSTTQEKINLILKDKKRKVCYCSGCTGFDYYNIMTIIQDEQTHSIVEIKKWIKKNLI